MIKPSRVSIRLLLWLLLAAVVTTGCTPAVTTVVLVRHAEKGAGTDPPLTPAGEVRAQALVDVADDAGLSAIYTTQFQRTQQTAAPLAAAVGLTPVVFSTSGVSVQQHATDLAADIMSKHQGKAVLVVGHSDTVPLIVQALGYTGSVAIGSNEFDRLLVVRKKKNVATGVIDGRYGP